MSNSIPECFYRISVKALITDETGRFLLIKEDNGLWDLPGGGLDHGENPQEGIRREMMEEMGLEPSTIAEEPEFFFTCINPKGQYIANVVYRATLPHLDFVPSSECVEAQFFGLDDNFDKGNMYPNIPVFVELFSKSKIKKDQ
ncbi:NUDIX hydrolase [Echinicola sp. CAU 1574]|uniref:NUDIX hydrolase n=1 Tax=Echinicola arenosa TaxID=2774144 RepID=A0ABR9AL15_9BACT|nr:NUDIX hydrolase [Echinicola arenosa]MBD8489047.1 NUDIX hydrolase [Echinicola arenosa]